MQHLRKLTEIEIFYPENKNDWNFLRNKSEPSSRHQYGHVSNIYSKNGFKYFCQIKKQNFALKQEVFSASRNIFQRLVIVVSIALTQIHTYRSVLLSYKSPVLLLHALTKIASKLPFVHARGEPNCINIGTFLMFIHKKSERINGRTLIPTNYLLWTGPGSGLVPKKFSSPGPDKMHWLRPPVPLVLEIGTETGPVHFGKTWSGAPKGPVRSAFIGALLFGPWPRQIYSFRHKKLNLACVVPRIRTGHAVSRKAAKFKEKI